MPVLDPEKFRLTLERPSQPENLKPEAEVVCVVTSSDTFSLQVNHVHVYIGQSVSFNAPPKISVSTCT